MSRFRKRFRKGERGQATVELVLLLPAIVALSTAILEFGWWVNSHIVVSNAAEAAATAVAQQGVISNQTVPIEIGDALRAGGQDVAAATYEVFVNGFPISSGSVQSPSQGRYCIPEGPGGFAPETVKVTVTYRYHMLFPFLRSPLFLDVGKAIPRTITASASLPVYQEWAPGAAC